MVPDKASNLALRQQAKSLESSLISVSEELTKKDHLLKKSSEDNLILTQRVKDLQVEVTLLKAQSILSRHPVRSDSSSQTQAPC